MIAFSRLRRAAWAGIVLLGLVLGAPTSVYSQSVPKRFYLAPDDHTDYMWSADEETYRRAFIAMLDYYLNLADATQNNPPDQQSRWNCDGSFWLWNYEKSKTKADFDRLMMRVRDGHIGFPLNALVSCYGGQPAEAVLRGMYYAGRLERRFGIRVPIAIAMENQTLPYGLGALWAGAGARYSWKGICGCDTVLRAALRSPTAALRPHEVYWWRGPDDSRILMKWNTLFTSNNKSFGGYAEAWDPVAAIALAETDERFIAANPYNVIGIFGKGWDRIETMTDEFVTVAREKTDAKRRVVVSNQLDYFQDMENTHGRGLPEFAASFGNEWDLYSASLPEVSARVRRAVETLRTAEALATLVGLQRPDFMRDREVARDQAWMALGIYWEHDWTADSSAITREARAAWGRKMAGQIESYVDSLLADSAYALGSLIAKRGPSFRFYVFNPLSWPRSDFVDVPYWPRTVSLDVANSGTGPVHVIDLETGEETPSQLVKLQGRKYLRMQQHLRINASEVPPLGYKVFEVRPGVGKTFTDAPVAIGDVIESADYRIKVAERGAITSLVDKRRANREFADPPAGRALDDLGPGAGKLEIENAGPVSVTLKATATGPLAHVTRITLFRETPRIEIQNEITQNFSDVQTWGFSFNLRSPDVWHEEVGAIIRAKLLADGGHYSATHSRLDWLTLNHFVAISGDDGAGVTLSNADCAFMKLGDSAVADSVSKLDVNSPVISVLVGGQVDGPKTGIPQQGGDSLFTQRFALQTHDRFSPAAAMRFALEHQNPLVAGIITGGHALPEKSYSLLKISDPNVLLWALKPAEEGAGHGMIARVWNMSAEPRYFALSLQTGIERAKQTTHIETDLADAHVTDGRLSSSCAPFQLLTFRVFPTAIPAR